MASGTRSGWFIVLMLSIGWASAARPAGPTTAERALTLLSGPVVASTGGALSVQHTSNIQILGCGRYPYQNSKQTDGARILAADLRQALRRGLSCLTGKGPAGALHPYHHAQARKLLALIESPMPKSFRCVSDQLFAQAVATSGRPRDPDDPLGKQLDLVRHPGVVLDTHRIAGLLSRKIDRRTLRRFYKLSGAQIEEHLTGSPLRLNGLHRVNKRPALLFHEMVHWLGHTHGNIRPDLAHLYETCCFGGSGYIKDEASNARFAKQACAMLKDKELWDANPYQRVRLWRFKGYDEFRGQMRRAYR